ncbi:MAG: AAA family ATPase [Bacteroidetes bacterium]|nr:AAA family ATPase [Bacteroidota bacterium]
MLYLKRLEIENVRCFGNKQKIDFTDSDGEISQWTVILGDNGTGKTSILRSIVSLLPSPQSFIGKRSHLDTEYDLSIDNSWRNAWDLRHKEGGKESKMKLIVVESGKPFGVDGVIELDLEYSINHKTKESVVSKNYNTGILSPVFCFAYGANRKMAEKSLSGESFNNSSATLFLDNAMLQNSSEYFLRVDYETAKTKTKKGISERDRIKDLLLQVLPDGIKKT